MGQRMRGRRWPAGSGYRQCYVVRQVSATSSSLSSSRSGSPADEVQGQNAPRSLVVTQGDPAGIGPELLLAAAREDRLVAGDQVVADPLALRGCAESLHAAGAGWAREALAKIEPFIDAGLGEAAANAGLQVPGGQYAALVRGVDLVLAQPSRALVTAPIDKAVASAEGLETPGHTEYLAQRAGVDDFAMAMVGSTIRLTLATIHLPLAHVPTRLDQAAVRRAGRLLAEALRRDFGVPEPRVAVCGLNPHAGEGGLLGHEDEAVVRPAIDALNAAHPWAEFSGPWPADAAFPLHARGRYDGVVAMYHDQGLAPFKLAHFDDGVNMTLGLPFVRTSPDHGTAKDIAGQGRANPSSFFEAIRLARGR